MITKTQYQRARMEAMKTIATIEDKQGERTVKGYIELLETELQLYMDYSAFLKSCASSGEQPETLEWFEARNRRS